MKKLLTGVVLLLLISSVSWASEATRPAEKSLLQKTVEFFAVKLSFRAASTQKTQVPIRKLAALADNCEPIDSPRPDWCRDTPCCLRPPCVPCYGGVPINPDPPPPRQEYQQ